MRTLLTVALVIAAGTNTGGSVAAADPPSVKAYSLTITRPPEGGSAEFFLKPYTSVGLFATLPGRSIIGLNTPACKLTFTDDKETDLTSNGQVTGLSPAVFVDTKTRSQTQIFISSNKLPASTASKLKLKGELVFLCGSGEKTATVEGFKIQKNEKKTVGPVTFEVKAVGSMDFVQITTEEPTVKSVMVVDKDGKLAGQINMGIYVKPGKDGRVVQSGSYYPLPNVQIVDIKLTYYEKVESVTVPVDVQIGIGG